MFQPGGCSRKTWSAAAVLAGLLVLPWYSQVPGLFSTWRVTDYWLSLLPRPGYSRVLGDLSLPWSFFSTCGPWGGGLLWDAVLGALFLLLAAAAWRRASRALFSPPRALLWVWFLAACLGPVLFDLARGTYVAAVQRYALAGMPAAFLLAGLGLALVRPPLRAAFLVLIAAFSLVGVRRIYLNESRSDKPYRQVGSLLGEEAGAGDLVIVHSIPSGVAGIARYMTRRADSKEGVGFASWVGQLKQRRVPDDLRSLAAGRKRILVVNIHSVLEPAPEITWLEENATLERERIIDRTKILYFVPRGKETFF
jgi:hypothetical protein